MIQQKKMSKVLGFMFFTCMLVSIWASFTVFIMYYRRNDNHICFDLSGNDSHDTITPLLRSPTTVDEIENVVIIPETEVEKGSTTIVSIWFTLSESKHGNNAYIEWSQYLCKTKSNLYVWADENSAKYILEYRARYGLENRTIVNITTLNESSSFLNDIDWNKQHSIDPEGQIHNINLYKIWNSKLELVNQVTEMNPFHTDYFFYFDIGYFRENPGFVNWPHLSYVQLIPRDRVTWLNVYSFTDEELSGTQYYFSRGDRIGGGAFGGTKYAINMYHDLYYNITREYDNDGMFWGKDQYVFNTIATNYNELVFLVKPNPSCGNWWFFLAAYLANSSELPEGCKIHHYIWG